MHRCRSRAHRPAVGPRLAKAVSNSRSVLACRTWSCSPRVRAAACMSCVNVSARRISGIDEHGNRVAVGITSCSSSSRFGPSSATNDAHASEVAARSVEAGNKPTLDRIEPAEKNDRNRRGCRLGYLSRGPIRGNHGHLPTNKVGGQRRQSIVLDCPPSDIRWRRSCRRRSRSRSGLDGTRANGAPTGRADRCVPRNPITGIAGCCARATTGHDAAEPPSREMNSPPQEPRLAQSLNYNSPKAGGL